MDDHLAAKLFSCDNLVMIGNLLAQSVDLFRGIPLGGGVSEQDRAANDALRAEVEGVVRECAAAYWLIAPMACVYQTMHVELAPADRLFVASYGFCVALLMIDMRRFVDPAFLPLQRHTTTSAERRWVYNDETWKKLMDHESWSLCFAVLCGLGEVVQPMRANVFGTLNEERFLSCIRRVCKSNDHYLHVMNMLGLTLAITAIRTRLGLGPDLEDGSKRQKHGDVLFEPLPRGHEGIPLCRART
jgi:hypothetical protein